jgi:hypothetical protein
VRRGQLLKVAGVATTRERFLQQRQAGCEVAELAEDRAQRAFRSR